MFGDFKQHMAINEQHNYHEMYPSEALEDYVALYWRSENISTEPHKLTICPDGYFKMIIQLIDDKIVSYFMTGLWTNEVEVAIQPKMVTYGIKFKIIAAEYIFKRSIKNILDSIEQLPLDYFDIGALSFENLPETTKKIEATLLENCLSKDAIQPNRVRLSQFIHATHGDIKAGEVANQIFWSQRDINRYMSKYVGISLKKYLNILKCYRSYLDIRNGNFFPEKGYFDQAHFIREVKKHTGETPRNLFKKQNDQFIQLKNIKKL